MTNTAWASAFPGLAELNAGSMKLAAITPPTIILFFNINIIALSLRWTRWVKEAWWSGDIRIPSLRAAIAPGVPTLKLLILLRSDETLSSRPPEVAAEATIGCGTNAY
jgi:hypothetical protein